MTLIVYLYIIISAHSCAYDLTVLFSKFATVLVTQVRVTRGFALFHRIFTTSYTPSSPGPVLFAKATHWSGGLVV